MGAAVVLQREPHRDLFIGVNRAIAEAAILRRDFRAGRDDERGVAFLRVVDDEGEVLIDRRRLVGHAVGVEVKRGDDDRHHAGGAGGQEHAFGVVAQIGVTAGDGEGPVKHVAAIELAVDRDGKIEVVVVGGTEGRAGSVGPAQRDAKGLGAGTDAHGVGAGLSGCGEGVGGILIAQHTWCGVKRGAEVHAAHALVVGPQGVIRRGAGQVARGVDQKSLGHRGTRGVAPVVDEELTDQRGAAGHRRCRVTGAGGGGVPLLAEREKVVGAAGGSAAGQGADAGAVEAGEPGSVAAHRFDVLRDAAGDVGAGGDDLGFFPVVAGRAAAGKTDDVVGAVRPAVAGGAAVETEEAVAAVGGGVGVNVFRCADGDDIFCCAGGTDGLGVGSGVAGGEHDDHGLVAGGGHRGVGGLRVAHEGVVLLGVGVVPAEGVGAPTVGTDAGAIAVGAGNQVAVVGAGEIVVVEDHRGAQFHERGDAEAVAIPGGVGVGEAGAIVEAGDDVRVDRAVSVAPLQRAANVGRTFEPVVDHAARQSGVAAGVEAKVVGVGAAVVETGVADVDGEAGGGELFLREAEGVQPCEVTGAGGTVARELAGDDHALTLVVFFRRDVRGDGNDIGLGGDAVKGVVGQACDEVDVVAHGALAGDGFERERIDQRQRGRVRRGIEHQLDGVESGGGDAATGFG